MSDIAGQTGLRGSATDADSATDVVHESYAFACMRCGHGWEQSYVIEHRTNAEGERVVRYVADGRVVPSPLSRPVCRNCDGHLVRIMRAGQVASVRAAADGQPHRVPAAGPVEVERVPGRAGRPHHWHLSDLLHPFHRKAG
ncbi:MULTISPECIES: hypothetical protein [Streptomyces]|uniref:hypothetical protein n=1 Tax=Streptomyces TaxID=1883 RepID=UPI001675ABE3|nr:MULTISPECIES: hypothetical protein [Streptomyces]MBK3526706.1 hypothetical protein [Streptomyces sp. MBT70]GGR62469.1 hypothetical protein GCM10010236_14670 [Streptomyces eurythermus]